MVICCLFSKHFPDYSVTLIEDPNKPSTSAGESVTPHVRDFILKLGIDEQEWIRETGAIQEHIFTELKNCRTIRKLL